MPKPKYNYTAYSVNKLLDDVSKISNVKINNIADCDILSGILAKSNIQISDYTLARLYKVIASKSLPSKYTLDKLSIYAGCENWDDFYVKFREKADESTLITDIKSDIISNNELMLLKYCIEDNALNPVINYFNKIIPLVSDPFSNDAKKIADFIGRTARISPTVQNKILPIITKNKELRDAVYTWWVDIDGLNLHYADIIEKQYINHLNRLDPDFSQNEIWAYSVLMHKAFFDQNISEFTRYAYYLYTKYNPNEISIKNGYLVFPFARFQSNHIIYRYFYQPKTGNTWYEEKIKFIKDEIQTIPNHAKIILLAFISEALAIAKKYEFILYFNEEYRMLTTEFIQNDHILREEDSLIKFIYYYNLANSKLNILNQDLKDNIICLSGTEKYITYQHTFSYFHNSAVQLFENEQKLKQHYLSEAKKHAQVIQNKYFLKEIRKSEE